MTAQRRRRPLLLIALALALLGDTCPLTGPPAVLSVELGELYPFGAGYFGEVNLVVTAELPFQAVDFDVTWDPSVVFWADGLPHPEFDDDGKLAMPPVFLQSQGRMDGIVDFRHGASTSGYVRTATIVLYAPLGGTTNLQVTGRVAGPTGEAFDVFLTTSLTLSD